MEDFSDQLDSLCRRIEPYVRSALEGKPMEPQVDIIDESALKEIEEEISSVEPDKGIMKILMDDIRDSFSSPSPEGLEKTRVRLETEMFTACWYETLRWSAKGKEVVKLRDCLLPEDLGRHKRAWDPTMIQLDFSQKEAEGILRKFGEEEIAYCLELPGGSYISRATGGYELRWIKGE
ncbi:MAG: hypothetical protein V1914_00330 [archaeon]